MNALSASMMIRVFPNWNWILPNRNTLLLVRNYELELGPSSQPSQSQVASVETAAIGFWQELQHNRNHVAGTQAMYPNAVYPNETVPQSLMRQSTRLVGVFSPLTFSRILPQSQKKKDLF